MPHGTQKFMYQVSLDKPDGRKLHLYSRRPISQGLIGTSPKGGPVAANPHLRWHPLLGEWVCYASHRQGRTFLPPPEFNPLAPSSSPEFPTELPVGDYDVAVFENLFPSMSFSSDGAPELRVPTRSAKGVCEVVVFSQESKTCLSQLPLDHIELLIEVWSERYRVLGAMEGIQYVMPFENRGVEMGVTLHHPHGQIYAYPFVPPVPKREIETQRAYFEKSGKTLLEDMISDELRDGRRLIFESEHVAAFVPVCARYPYEVWVAPKKTSQSLAALTAEQKLELARALKMVTSKYDGLWNRPFPYLMIFKQAPTSGRDYPEVHVHAQFYPIYRTKDRLKYLAGTELGAGMFANDSLPEEKAAELRQVEVSLE